MHSETEIDKLDNVDDVHEQQNFVGNINIPGFVDDTMIYMEVDGTLSRNETVSARATAASRTDSSAAAVPVPDLDSAVISVFVVAVILLVVGQVVIVCRKRYRRSCQRRCRKWNVPVFNQQLHGFTTSSRAGGSTIHSPPPSDVWTAVPASPLSDLFHADIYRTPAFAYINRRSTDSLPSTAAVASRTGSGSSGSPTSSTAAIFARPESSVTWSDVGEMTSSTPDKRPTTSLSLSSTSDAAEPRHIDAESQTDDGHKTANDRPAIIAPSTEPTCSATDEYDDVNIESSASVSCSPTHSLRSACDDVEVHQDLRHQNSLTITVHHTTPCHNLSQDGSLMVSVDHSEPASPSTISNSSTDLPYMELTTDCSTAHQDTDNSTC